MSLWDDMNVNLDTLTDADTTLDAQSNPNAQSAFVGRDVDKNAQTVSDHVITHEDAAKGPSKRFYACSPCRERKVRCDRGQPMCGHCLRRGHICTYSSQSKQSITKLDLSRLLLDLQERLRYAESQGVFQQPQSTVNPQTNNIRLLWPDLDNFGSISSIPTHEDTMPGQEYWQSLPVEMAQQFEFADGPLETTKQPTVSHPMPSSTVTSLDIPVQDWSHIYADSTLVEDLPGSLVSSELAMIPHVLSDIPSANATSRIHNAYFDVFDCIMPAIHRERFEIELVHSPQSMQVQALSQAIATLGALAAPELGHAINVSYMQTRTLLEMCERQESGDMLHSINTLQACVLLGFYELKQANFTRAWLTLGRGIRLGKILGFMRPQRLLHSRTRSQTASLVPSVQDTEERRRTMWLLYILDAFAVMRTEWEPAFDEMTLPLPSPGNLADVTDTPVMPTIAEAFEGGDTHTLSTFGGLACVISTYRQCFDHIRLSKQDVSYVFWDNYYRIDKLVSKCRACFQAQHSEPVSFTPSNPLSFILFMNLAAVEVQLHKAAMDKAENQHPNRNSLATEAETRCLQASADITQALRACCNLAAHDLNVFRQASTFFTSATTTAVQAHLWMLGHGRGSRNTHVANLHVLANILREYVGAEQVLPTLLSQVDAVLTGRTGDRSNGGGRIPAKRRTPA